MDKLFNYLQDNKDWIFSGIGIFLLGGFVTLLKKMIFKNKDKTEHNFMNQYNQNNSTGTQIGIQNNYYRKENNNGKE